jgi:TatD DNase family protein
LDYIDIHTHSKSASGKAIINIFPADEPSEVKEELFSIGLHPWYIDPDNYLKKLSLVLEMAKSKSCIAIGETGLDKLIKTDFDQQKSIFIRHIEIAEELNKPLIIHCVRAFDELVNMKRLTGSTVKWIVHGFNSKNQIAEKLLQEKIILSFGRHLKSTNSNAAKVLGWITEDEFFLETDDGDMTIQEVYAYAAKIRDLSTSELKTIIQSNYKRTFRMQNG